jgi:DNA-directed RNA polymerase subunit omega
MSTQQEGFGITYPAIDDLLAKVSDVKGEPGSKFALAAYGAARARQIVSYYSQLNSGLLENVGPLVDYYAQEKPLSIAMREIDQDKLELVAGSTTAIKAPTVADAVDVAPAAEEPAIEVDAPAAE